MSKAARVKFSTENLTQVVSEPNSGISFVLGQSVRGPFANPEDIINSWPKFVEIYGGLSDVSDAPSLARRILERGGSIRFSRVGHYTDPTDETTLDALKGTPSPTILFEIDGPFVTDNEIDVTVNGTPLTTLDFITDSNTTYEALATALRATSEIQDAIVIDNGSDAIDMYIVPAKGVTLALTDITITGGVTQPTDSQTDVTSIVDEAGNELFDLVLKNEGADGNNIFVEIGEASNGSENYFKITITHVLERTVETYDNLYIDGNKLASQSNYLKDIVNGSSFVDVLYKDHNTFSGQLVPLKGISYSYIGGTDGSAVEDADYIGDPAAKTGLYAFDSYDDAYGMAVLDNYSDGVNVAGASYAELRADLQFVVHLENSLKNKTALIAKRDSLGITTKYAYIVAGGIRTIDPITGLKVDKPEHADVIALASRSATDFGPWYSFAGTRRGALSGVLGVVNNFGTPATFNDLNDLANKQINMVITRNGQTVLWGNHSAQLLNDQESKNNIVRLIIYLKKSLKPTLETFLEEPNDIPTWNRIWYTVKPFLDSLVTNRAVFSYDWQGDQNASDFDSLVVNNATDVSNGTYKIKLSIAAIAPIEEIDITVILTRAGVSFSDISGLI